MNVFSNIQYNYYNHQWLHEGNTYPISLAVSIIRKQILQQLHDVKVYKSVHIDTDPRKAVNYPNEILNSLKLSGMPLQRVILKRGVQILFRNLDVLNLCHSTGLAIKQLMPYLIDATILWRKDVFIQKFQLFPVPSHLISKDYSSYSEYILSHHSMNFLDKHWI